MAGQYPWAYPRERSSNLFSVADIFNALFNERQWCRSQTQFHKSNAVAGRDRKNREIFTKCIHCMKAVGAFFSQLPNNACPPILTIYLGRKVKMHDISNNTLTTKPTRRCRHECLDMQAPHTPWSIWGYSQELCSTQTARGSLLQVSGMRSFTVCACCVFLPTQWFETFISLMKWLKLRGVN